MGTKTLKHRVIELGNSFSRQYKAFLASILEQIAFLGIDLELQIDSLREDFVKSRTFLDYVNKVFDECDVDKNDQLEPAEFYAAVLLLYHQLNKIPFGRKKFPPEREVIMRLFDECYEQQLIQLRLMEDAGEILTEGEELVVHPKHESELRRIAPRVLREGFFSLLFFALYLMIYNLWICRSCEASLSLGSQILSGVTALTLGLLLYNGTEIMITEQPELNKVFGTEPEKVTVVRAISKPAFIALCQDHFTDVLASETWRIVSVAIILPLLAFQFKKFVFSFSLFNAVFSNQSFVSEDLIIPAFVSLILLAFPFIDSMVEKNLLWNDFYDGQRPRRRRSMDPERYKETSRKSLERLRKEYKQKVEKKRKNMRNNARKSIRRITGNSEIDKEEMAINSSNDSEEANTKLSIE